eukprot:1186369-Prorocentrum_minimum.AAC.1
MEKTFQGLAVGTSRAKRGAGMLSSPLRLAPTSGICSLPPFDWLLTEMVNVALVAAKRPLKSQMVWSQLASINGAGRCAVDRTPGSAKRGGLEGV